MHRPLLSSRCSVLLVVSAIALSASSCVTFYQPLVGLQEPVAVDPQAPNLAGTRVLIRCQPDEVVKTKGAELLCRKMRTLFSTQGALVETEVPREGLAPVDAPSAPATRPDLIIDLRSRLLHSDTSVLQALFSVVTLTLAPMMSEFTFAQDVKIRDVDGFLLASESLQGRFEQYFGFGIWAVQSLLDWLVRSPAEKLTGDAPKKDFSRDLFAQLSQMAFQARMRSLVLRSVEPSTATASPRGITK